MSRSIVFFGMMAAAAIILLSNIASAQPAAAAPVCARLLTADELTKIIGEKMQDMGPRVRDSGESECGWMLRGGSKGFKTVSVQFYDIKVIKASPAAPTLPAFFEQIVSSGEARRIRQEARDATWHRRQGCVRSNRSAGARRRPAPRRRRPHRRQQPDEGRTHRRRPCCRHAIGLALVPGRASVFSEGRDRIDAGGAQGSLSWREGSESEWVRSDLDRRLGSAPTPIARR